MRNMTSLFNSPRAKNKLTLVLGLGLSLLLFSCSNLSTTTNLDSENFVNYFAPSKVKIYPNEQALPAQHRLIGLVEGQDCQIKAHHAQPDEINARTDARRKANALNANGIIFSECALIEDKSCHAMLLCYGKAYQILESTDK